MGLHHAAPIPDVPAQHSGPEHLADGQRMIALRLDASTTDALGGWTSSDGELWSPLTFTGNLPTGVSSSTLSARLQRDGLVLTGSVGATSNAEGVRTPATWIGVAVVEDDAE